jgi:hypothetical protein
MAYKKKENKSNVSEDLFSELWNEIEQARDDSQAWRDKTDRYYRLRIREKKTKNFPFPGCSNLRLPTIETYIRKTKAALVALYANVKPRMMVVPQSDRDLDKARRIEKFLDWLCDTKIKLLEKLVLISDKTLERGFCLAKVVWRMEDNCYTETISLDDLSIEEASFIFDLDTTDEQLTEAIIKKYNVDMSESVQDDNLASVAKVIQEIHSGKETVKLHLRDELYNAPDVVVVDPLYAHVPTDAKRNPNDNRFVGHEYYESYETLKKMAEYGSIDKEAIENIDWIKAESTNNYDNELIEMTKDTREGVDRLNNPSHLVKIVDLYTYYDLDGDGLEEKCHFLLAPDFRQVLKKQRLENDSQKFPFVRFETEIIDDRWYSPRGYPEHLEDMSKEIDAQHNQKLDSQTIRNAPMFMYRSGIINPRLIKFIPGQAIPVPGMSPLNDAIAPLEKTNPNAEFSYEREEMMLKSTIQEYLGQLDYSVQSMINKRQPRTLGEVQMQAQAANIVFYFDSTIFANALSEIYSQILELCQQYMPERVFALVVGEEGVEPINMSRDEIQGKYTMVARGNDVTSNPQLRIQDAMTDVQILLSSIPLQTGVVNPMNVFQILKRYLQSKGELAWQALISQPQQQPPPVAPEVRINFDDLTDGEQAQVLSSRNVKPDVQGRALKSSAMIQEKQAEQEKTTAEVAKTYSEVFSNIGGDDEEEKDAKARGEDKYGRK